MNVARTSLLLAPLAIVARGIAFFVPVVLAGWFGVSPDMDAFFYALNIPTFFLVLGAGAIATVLVPTLATLGARAPEERGRFVGAVSLWAAGSSVGIGILIGLALPTAMRLTTFDAATRDAAVGFYWALLPALGLNATNSVLKAACEVQGRFAQAGTSPVVRTAGLIGVAWAFLARGPAVLPWALAAGLLVEGLWLAAILVRAGVIPRPRLAVPPALLELGRGLLPVLVGETLVALNVVVDKQFAATLPVGSVSVLEYADRARLIPQTLLESSLMVVAFNAWARARARGDEAGRHEAVARALWWVGLLAPPVLGGMVVGREALIRLLFEHGAFDPAYTGPTASALGAFLPGVFFSLLGALVVKAHVVAGRYGLVMRLGVLSFVLNAGMDALLAAPAGTVGLAWATSVTNLVVVGWAFTALLPEIRGTLPRAELRWMAGLLATTVCLTAAATLLLPTPESVADGRLWALAVPYLMLLGVGAAVARRGGP